MCLATEISLRTFAPERRVFALSTLDSCGLPL
jgi:hypothetical protein